MARIAAAVARELGRPEEAARDEQLFARIRADFNARFLSPAGSYREREEQGFVQTAQILPLAFALAPDERRAAIAARLAEDITGARGGNAWVGVIGARYVLPVLTATGHHDAACQAATQTDEPSWGYWTDVAGFTALGEHWPADTRSRNHHFFGTIVQWLYEDLAGIRPLEPGYRKVELKPAIPAAGIGAVSASYESVRGTIASRWRRRDGGLEWEVVVPANATARVHVPAGAAGVVREGAAGQEVPADRAEGVRLVGAADGRVVYEVGSGRYRFQVR
jgi:alpha-L-rhamnosidase